MARCRASCFLSCPRRIPIQWSAPRAADHLEQLGATHPRAARSARDPPARRPRPRRRSGARARHIVARAAPRPRDELRLEQTVGARHAPTRPFAAALDPALVLRAGAASAAARAPGRGDRAPSTRNSRAAVRPTRVRRPRERANHALANRARRARARFASRARPRSRRFTGQRGAPPSRQCTLVSAPDRPGWRKMADAPGSGSLVAARSCWFDSSPGHHPTCPSLSPHGHGKTSASWLQTRAQLRDSTRWSRLLERPISLPRWRGWGERNHTTANRLLAEGGARAAHQGASRRRRSRCSRPCSSASRRTRSCNRRVAPLRAGAAADGGRPGTATGFGGGEPGQGRASSTRRSAVLREAASKPSSGERAVWEQLGRGPRRSAGARSTRTGRSWRDATRFRSRRGPARGDPPAPCTRAQARAEPLRGQLSTLAGLLGSTGAREPRRRAS